MSQTKQGDEIRC